MQSLLIKQCLLTISVMKTATLVNKKITSTKIDCMDFESRGVFMLSFLISVCGFIFGYRQIEKISLKLGQNQPRRLFFHGFFSISLLFGTFFFAGSPHILWFFQGMVLIAVFFTPVMIIYSSKREFKHNFPRFLDQIILSMHSGANFRRSFQQLIQFESGFMKVQLQEILNHLVYPTKTNLILDPSMRNIVVEFLEIDQMSAKSLDHLKSFRQLWRLQLEFERKESQIKESVKAQTAILII